MSLDQFDLVRSRRPLPRDETQGPAVLEGMLGVVLSVQPDCVFDHEVCYRVWFEDGTTRSHMDTSDLEPAETEEPDSDCPLIGCLAFAGGVVVGAIVLLIVLALIA